MAVANATRETKFFIAWDVVDQLAFFLLILCINDGYWLLKVVTWLTLIVGCGLIFWYWTKMSKAYGLERLYGKQYAAATILIDVVQVTVMLYIELDENSADVGWWVKVLQWVTSIIDLMAKWSELDSRGYFWGVPLVEAFQWKKEDNANKANEGFEFDELTQRILDALDIRDPFLRTCGIADKIKAALQQMDRDRNGRVQEGELLDQCSQYLGGDSIAEVHQWVTQQIAELNGMAQVPAQGQPFPVPYGLKAAREPAPAVPRAMPPAMPQKRGPMSDESWPPPGQKLSVAQRMAYIRGDWVWTIDKANQRWVYRPNDASAQFQAVV